MAAVLTTEIDVTTGMVAMRWKADEGPPDQEAVKEGEESDT